MLFNTEGRVVVGIDGSVESLAALRWSLRHAVQVGAPVEVVHCWHSSLLTDFLGSPHELHRGSICMLQNEVAAAMAELPPTPEVRQSSEHGRAVPVLLDRATGARLLVLGSHGHTGVHRTGLGHVVAACLRHATCPVVVVDHAATVLEHTGRAVAGSWPR